MRQIKFRHLLLVQINDEVLLGLEAAGQLLGGQHSKGAFLGFYLLVRLHATNVGNYKAIRQRPFRAAKLTRRKCGNVRKRYA